LDLVIIMVNVTIKSFLMYGWSITPAPTEYIITNQYPMLYLVKPETAKELISKIENATIKHVTMDFPKYLIKQDKANELISKFT